MNEGGIEDVLARLGAGHHDDQRSTALSWTIHELPAEKDVNLMLDRF
jgi:hypothetical protein